MFEDYDFDDDVDEMKKEEAPIDNQMRKMDIQKAIQNQKLNIINNYKFKKENSKLVSESDIK